MKKSTITILICILFSIGLKAQLSADSHLANINFMSGTNVHGYGFGGSYLKAFTGKFLIGFTANIYLGGKQVTSDTAFANGGWPTADPILVDVTRKVISYTGDLDLRYYLVGDAEGDVAVYGLLGAGVLKGVIRTKTIGSYDTYSYYINQNEGDLGDFTGLTANLGAGFEKNIGSNYFFVNARYHHIVKYFSEDAPTFAPKSFVTLDLGLRFPF